MIDMSMETVPEGIKTGVGRLAATAFLLPLFLTFLTREALKFWLLMHYRAIGNGQEQTSLFREGEGQGREIACFWALKWL